MFDIYVLPLNIESGKENPELPGLYVAFAPRSANRHRSGEALILFLNTNANPAVPLPRLQGFLESLAATYFTTSGSVTAAIRIIIKQFNDTLLKSNLNRAREGKQTIGILNLVVLHKEQLYFVHAGDTRSLLLAPNQAEDFHYPQSGSTGLGLRDNPDLHYYQGEVQSGSTLILSPHLADGITHNLPGGGARISLEQIRRRLLNQARDNAHISVIQFQTGKGLVHYLKPRQSAVDNDLHENTAAAATAASPAPKEIGSPAAHIPPFTAPPASDPIESDFPGAAPQPESAQAHNHQIEKTTYVEEPNPAPPAQVQPAAPVPPPPPQVIKRPAPVMARPVKTASGSWDNRLKNLLKRVYSPQHDSRTPPSVNTSVKEVSSAAPVAPPQTNAGGIQETHAPAAGPLPPIFNQPGEPVVEQTAMPQSKPATAPTPAPLDKIPWQKWLAKTLQGGKDTGDRVKQGGNTLLARMLPGQQEQLPQLSPSTMLVIAVGVPLFIVAIAVTIYQQLGPQQQFRTAMNRAEQTAAQIAHLDDVSLQIAAMQQTVSYIDEAESHQVNEQSRSLRNQIQGSLDGYFKIKRIEYSPISDNLDGTVKISKIVTNATDTYLLDSTQGRVIRLTRNGQQYRMDYNFKCNPGQIGTVRVDKLVDIVVMPATTPNKATVMGIDKNGNLLYCIPGVNPLTRALPSPDMGWRNITAMAMGEDGLLYVLDGEGNSVYIFLNDNYTYPDPPRLYFNNQIPNDMAHMVTMAINRNELYLLNQDGHMVNCTFRAYAEAQTRCTDPILYRDDRPGREGETLRLEGTNFNQIYLAGVPDPSVFLLDQESSSLYQLSLRMSFYRQLKMQLYPERTPAQHASAFSISPTRVIWIAYGNEVFYGMIP